MSFIEQFNRAGYKTAPDDRLPLSYLPETLRLMARIADDVVEGTLHKVRTGELDNSKIITNEAGGAAAIVTFADMEAERQLTPL